MAAAIDESSNSIKVTWSSATVSEDYTPNYRGYYKKYDSTDTSPSGSTEATTSYPVSGTEYTVYGLEPFTEYIFYVKATSASYTGTGVDSDYSDSSGRSKTNVAAPENVENTVKSTTSIEVTWDKVTGATSYKVYKREAEWLDGKGIESATLYDTVTTNKITITGLTYLQMYYFYVRASNSAGTGSEASTGRFIW